ncbi:uncharacterized protein [Amphiura filiformis]|uniref:uncharacterized protein isoform X2 n=1 Tax=Amphiura filiformis TaxID=82378 RepID=UPI003B222F7F
MCCILMGNPVCRYRCLKCCGSFLFIIGLIFIGGGIVFALSETDIEIFQFLAAFNYSYITLWGGIGALVAGISAMYVGFRMSDDDCSARGMAIMCVLAIASTAGTMAVLTWNLYEQDYFGDIGEEARTTKLEQYVIANTPADTFEFKYEDWLASIIIYGAMCFLTIITWASSAASMAIGCCCPDASERVKYV